MILFRIDPLDDRPLFEQLVFQVKAAVAKGQLVQGDRLPSVRELAQLVQVNPNTVVKAYQHLEQAGLVLRRQGSGCFITGRGSDLAGGAKDKRLADLLREAATEAFHLGFQPEEVRAALDQEIAALDFTKDVPQ